MPVFAAESESKELEKAICLVKSVITIPKELTEFSQSSYKEENVDGMSVTVWDFNWNSEDDTSQLYVSIDSDENFLRYRFYTDQEENGLAKITRATGEKTALSFLKKLMPKYSSDFRQINEKENQNNSYNLCYTYQPYVNDVALRFITTTICIDKYTGTVTSFHRNDTPFAFSKLPSKEDSLTKEEAEKTYFEQFGMDLNYYSYYDRKKETLSVFPAYVNVAKANQALDAKTGKVVKLYRPIRFYGMNNEKQVTTMDAGGGLSPQEQKEVDDIAGLISKEKANDILKNAFRDLSFSEPSHYRLYELENTPNQGQYVWNLSYENAYGSLDAKTGEILSYYIYGEESDKGKANLKQKTALSMTEALLNKILTKDKLDVVKRQESQSKEESAFYDFNYYRQENGIDFVDNYVSVTVNKESGKIIQYNCNWYDTVTFPSIEKAMNSQQAYEAYKKLLPFTLNYERLDEKKVGLVYNFDTSGQNWLLQAETGVRLDWQGRPFKEETVPEYMDIKGHWSESVVNELKENGYYLEGEKFQPNRKITQKEFLIYLNPYYRNFEEEEELYEALIGDGILKKGEENLNTILNRQDAAKLMIRSLHLDKAAEHPELFQSVFKDKVEYSYKGYATLCKGLKILSGDKKGNFNGIVPMTRAEAAMGIYQLLNSSN